MLSYLGEALRSCIAPNLMYQDRLLMKSLHTHLIGILLTITKDSLQLLLSEEAVTLQKYASLRHLYLGLRVQTFLLLQLLRLF